MKTTEFIEFKLNRLSKGYVFTYEDFLTEVNKREAIIKALNRMAAAGRIIKLSKGKFYKAEKSVFGNLNPNQYQIVKDLLEDDGKLIGYLTGLSIYNQLGLTTQVSNTIQIGKNQVRNKLKRGIYNISFIKQKNAITKQNIPLLQILDALRYIKKIPDATIESSIKRFLEIIKKLNEEELKNLVHLSMKYLPSTRALLGSILETVGISLYSDKLFTSLNSITIYEFDNAEKVLSNTSNWNIK